MREERKHIGFRVLLVGDTHPEMIAIAKILARNKIDFRIVLPTYFTARESRFLSSVVIRGLGLNAWLRKRTLDTSIKSNSVIRKHAFLETCTWLFKRFGYHRMSWEFAMRYKNKLSNSLLRIIDSYRPHVLVSYDTIKVPRLEKIRHIVICPMSHPIEVTKSLAEAKRLFPTWPEMDDEKPLGINETAKFADRVIVLSRFAKNSYLSQGFEESKLEVIHIGPINGNSQMSPPLETEKKILRILFLGRMTRVKGVEALARLSNSLSPTKFQIILVGQCPPNISAYIRQISNCEVLTLVENPSPEVISEHFLNSDVFALPSFNEGFNISALEAMSYGLVPVLSKNAGVSEILENTSLAQLVIDPGSIDQLAQCFNYLSNLEQSDFNNLSNISFQLSKNFSFDKFAKDFLKVLNQELSR